MKTRPEIEAAVRAALVSVAPEADPAAIARTEPIRDQLDIDSMDFLRFVVALHHDLGVDVPERDYAKLATLESCVDYLEERSRHPKEPS
jgi:acyl carrier protein